MDEKTGKCPHCGGGNIVVGVRVDQTADAGRIGLAYKTKFVLGGTEPFYADVCDDCGTITRIYVKETGKNWYRK
ncbi:MAG: hypothetical protein GXX82_02350 [Syntrophorhabdus sp.]|jgi:hypothetical protein|nr:hypothetical protein [Syntrophorhabdus sp.]